MHDGWLLEEGPLLFGACGRLPLGLQPSDVLMHCQLSRLPRCLLVGGHWLLHRAG